MKVDYIIIGQGLAGSLIAYRLVQYGYNIVVIDDRHFYSSSKVSAGIINPVTGKRFAFSWRYKEVLSETLRLYQDLSIVLGREIIEPRVILRRIATIEALNDVYVKFSDVRYEGLFADLEKEDRPCESSHYVGINGYVVHVSSMLQQIRKWLEQQELIRYLNIDYKDIVITEKNAKYRDIDASAVIFCDGAMAVDNPFFPKELIVPFHGQVISARPDTQSDIEQNRNLIKDRYYRVPLDNGDLWFGSINERERRDIAVDISAYRNLVEEFETRMTKDEQWIFKAQTGVRPTTVDRRPIVGKLHGLSAYVLNGLGTKGASLGPYCSKYLIDRIHREVDVDPEMDISRFF